MSAHVQCRRAGFTLIEVMTASALVSIVALGIISGLQLVEKTDALARETRVRQTWVTTQVANRAATLTKAQALAFGTVTTTGAVGQPTDTTLTETIALSTLPDLYRISFTLAWTDSAGAGQNSTIQTLVYLP